MSALLSWPLTGLAFVPAFGATLVALLLLLAGCVHWPGVDKPMHPYGKPTWATAAKNCMGPMDGNTNADLRYLTGAGAGTGQAFRTVLQGGYWP